MIDEKCLNSFRSGYAELVISELAQEFEWTREFTQRVLRDALRFLELSVVPSPEARVMVSSPIVDRVVDAIFLDTPLLMWLEERFGCTRLVHIPAYAHKASDAVVNNIRYEFAIALMQSAGYELDRDLIWPARLPVGYMPCAGCNDLDDCLVLAVR